MSFCCAAEGQFDHKRAERDLRATEDETRTGRHSQCWQNSDAVSGKRSNCSISAEGSESLVQRLAGFGMLVPHLSKRRCYLEVA
jgi:hypothetical protein